MTTKVLQPEIEHDSGYFDVAGFASAALASASALASVFDHTLLKPEATHDQVAKLCEEAATYRFACAMVNPAWVSLAHSVMVGSGVPVGQDAFAEAFLERQAALKRQAHRMRHDLLALLVLEDRVGQMAGPFQQDVRQALLGGGDRRRQPAGAGPDDRDLVMLGHCALARIAGPMINASLW